MLGTAKIRENKALRVDTTPLKAGVDLHFIWMDALAQKLQNKALFGGTRTGKHIWTIPDPMGEEIYVVAIGALGTTQLPFTHMLPLDYRFMGEDVTDPSDNVYPFYENRGSNYGYRLLVQDLCQDMFSLGLDLNIALLDHQHRDFCQERLVASDEECGDSYFDTYHFGTDASYHPTFRDKQTFYFVRGNYGLVVEVFKYQGVFPYGGQLMEPYPVPVIRYDKHALQTVFHSYECYDEMQEHQKQQQAQKSIALSLFDFDEPVAKKSVLGVLDSTIVHDTIEKLKRAYEENDAILLGYSGGKDSHSSLQLLAMMALEMGYMDKPVVIISSNTGVENPRLVEHIHSVKAAVEKWATEHDLPFQFKLVEPKPEQSFWTNVIGRAYRAPSKDFKFCVDRLKLKPAEVVLEHIMQNYDSGCMIIGTRLDESSERKRSVERHSLDDFYGTHAMQGIRTGMPIKEWSTDDVFSFLLHYPAPWQSDYSNMNLIDLYNEANSGECPIAVVNVGANEKQKRNMSNSCSGSRMGCFVCTLVENDRSLEEMSKKAEGAYDGHLFIRKTLRNVSDVSNGLRTGIQRTQSDNTWTQGYGELSFEASIILLETLKEKQIFLTPDECSTIEHEWERRIKRGEIGVSRNTFALLHQHREGQKWVHPEWFCDCCDTPLTAKERRISRQSTYGHICIPCLGKTLSMSVEQTHEYVDMYICPNLSE